MKNDAGAYDFLYVGPGTIVMLLAEGQCQYNSVLLCSLIQVYGPVILMVRVYVFYERQKKVLVLLCLLTTISTAFNAVQAYGVTGKLVL